MSVGLVDFVVEMQNWELVKIRNCCFDFHYASDYNGRLYVLVSIRLYKGLMLKVDET